MDFISLNIKQHDVYTEFEGFLADVVTWIQTRRGGRMPLIPKPRNSNALTVVRDDPVWHGVGVYTVPELFHIAGELSIAVFLTSYISSMSRFIALPVRGEAFRFTFKDCQTMCSLLYFCR